VGRNRPDDMGPLIAEWVFCPRMDTKTCRTPASHSTEVQAPASLVPWVRCSPKHSHLSLMPGAVDWPLDALLRVAPVGPWLAVPIVPTGCEDVKCCVVRALSAVQLPPAGKHRQRACRY
jgi:hypothetical protein